MSKGRRQFKLRVYNFITNAISWDSENPNELETGEEIHVIEYSAYEDLRTERDELKAQIEDAKIQVAKLIAKFKTRNTVTVRGEPYESNGP